MMSGGEGEGATGTRAFALLAVLLLASLAVPTLVARAAVGDDTLLSRASGADGAAANGDSGGGIAVSASGRYVAFESQATNLADGAVPGVTNVYVRDTTTNTVTLISRADGPAGAGAEANASNPAISPAGRFVAFESGADNLSPDDDNSVQNIYVRDTATGTTTLVSRAADGAPANGDSSNPSISANGAFIAFQSVADNLSGTDDDSVSNIYIRDMATGTVGLVSAGSAPTNVPANGNSSEPTIDKDGTKVAFLSDADNLSTKDNDGVTNIFVRDLRFGSMTLASRATDTFLQTLPADGNSFEPVISADGRYIAFTSDADNLSEEDDNSLVNAFVRDTQGSLTTLVSRADGVTGAAANGSSSHPSISGDGRFVAFVSAASNLATGDVGSYDLFVRDLTINTSVPATPVCVCTTTLASRANGESGPPATGSSIGPTLSRDGRYLAFASEADNLSAADDDTVWNVFERRLRLSPPPVDAGPDLGSNDHSGHTADEHAGHTAAEHAGHTAAEHAGHVSPTGGPAETLFGPTTQDVDSLFVLAQVHADGKLLVTASVKLPGGGKATKLLRFRPFSRVTAAHTIFRVRLKLSKTGLRSVKRALKKHHRLRAVVVGQAQFATGGPWSSVTRKIKLRN
jgi:Tol biopolymer transport system component